MSAYFGWLNSAQHFRKVDQYVTWKTSALVAGEVSAQTAGVLKTPLAYWRKAGLYTTQGRIVHTS